MPVVLFFWLKTLIKPLRDRLKLPEVERLSFKRNESYKAEIFRKTGAISSSKPSKFHSDRWKWRPSTNPTPCIPRELLKFKLTNQNSASGKNCAIRRHVNRFAVKGPETHLKDFVETFLPTNFGAKTGLPASGDSNVSCCALAVICAFSNYFMTNSVRYFRLKCKKKSKLP